MQPITNLSSNFLPDQTTKFEVKVWDTPYAALDGTASNLKASAGLQLRVREPVAGQSWTTYANNFVNASATTIETSFLDGTRSQFTRSQGSEIADGRTPVAQHYWGSGAPNWWGGSVAGQVALCFSGQLVAASERGWFSSGATPTLTFAAAGSGLIKIVKVPTVGSPTVLLNADLTEVEYLQSGFKLSTSVTFAEGDIVRVYYVQRGTEPWGGLVVKVIEGTLETNAKLKAKQEAEAPVLSGGLFAHGGTFAGVTLDFVKSVDIQHELGSASRATLEVPLMTPTSGLNDGHGWIFNRPTSSDPGTLQLYDLGVLKFTLKRKRLIQVTAFTPDAAGALTTRVPVFTGFVDDFADVSGGTAKITCVGMEGRLVEQYEQAPDRISYMARGFRLVDLLRAQDFQTGQPVYNIPAFDAWPVAYAVEELAVRAGIDPSRFRKTFEVLSRAGTVTTVSGISHLARQVRAFTPNGTAIRLPRPVNYGNAGIAFTENRPFDDQYLFKVEPTKDLWARTRELTDRIGYRMRFDEAGYAALYPANNATHVYDLVPADATVGTPVQRTNAAAYGAKYLETTGSATIVKTVTAARIDVVFPRQSTLGAWTVVVKSGATPLRTVVVSPGTGATTTYQHLYSSQITQPDVNSCVTQVWPDPNLAVSPGIDTLTVELTSSGGTGSTIRAVDCILAYAVDPNRSLLPIALSTGETALSASAQSSQDEMRNKVTIVGRRKALVTDSDKFAESRQPTEQEFVVENEVDAKSIFDPTSTNYVGYPKQSVIYDDSISDNGFARYLAKTFIYRQKVPRPAAAVEALPLPMLQPGDAVQVTETRYKTMENAIVYIRSVTHRFTEKRATTSLSTQAWPDWPAFEPRYDINLADFNNNPVTDVNLNYTTLSGHAVTNLNGDAVRPVQNARFTGAAGSGSIVEVTGLTETSGAVTVPSDRPWPPMPGTLQVRQSSATLNPAGISQVKVVQLGRYKPYEQITEMQIQPDWTITQVRVIIYTNSGLTAVSAGPYILGQDQTTADQYYYKLIDNRVVLFKSATPQFVFVGTLQFLVTVRKTTSEVRQSWVGNNPYHEFTSFSYANGARTLTLGWKQGDETTRFAKAASSWDVRYKALFPTVANSDPNIRPGGVADNGYAYSPFYDPYTSELGYLVNVQFTSLAEGLYRASIRSAADNTVVAWLTNSTADASQPDKHWQYLQVGLNDFYWDGVDQVGEWNTKQSELYATLVDGAFGDDGEQRERVGKGFYAWNREVGGGTYPPIAHIWMQRDANGRPYIGHGTYGQWYVLVEAVTDQLAGTTYFDTNAAGNVLSAKYIYTHLPEPTKVQLQVRDWSSNTEYTTDTPAGIAAAQTEGNWSTLTPQYYSALSAFIHNGKPIRLRYKVLPRPGALWYIPGTVDNTDEVSVKLTRYVHLRVQIGDQTILDKGNLYPGSTTKDRVVVNRRLTNDEHTNSFPDEGYRKAKTLKWSGNAGTLEWIFRPKDFKREFRYAGIEESIEFGNYLQIEEVPGWSNTRDVATQRAKLQFAIMSYLFYLSTMSTDRSGRSTWALNVAGNGETGFVDQSKIVNNAAAVTFGDDPMYQLRRTIVCRQWAREPDPTDATTNLTTKRTWVNAQLTRLGGTTTGPLAALLEHHWMHHDVTYASVGITYVQLWSAFNLTADAWSAWGQGAGGNGKERLPSGYEASRQLGSYSGGSVLSNVTGWTWSSDPVWIPSITRDLHPYFLLPPMVLPPMDVSTTKSKIADPLGRFVLEYDLRKWNCFLTTAGPDLTIEHNEASYTNLKQENWSDNAHAETWSSAIWDMTEASSARRHFYPATKVDKEQAPCKKEGIAANTLDYIRQDETVHWEDLRGMYSRSKLPASGVVKVTPVAPYYINTWRHYGIGSRDAFRNPGYPAFYVIPKAFRDVGLMECFRTAFRHEYVWESGSFFPASQRGAEALYAMLWWRTQFLSMAEIGSVYYDHGAWVGWKDDVVELGSTRFVYGGRMKDFSSTEVTDFYTPFAASWIPVAVSSTLPTTVELSAHLVLVSERRGY